jgi:hypothetical protein
MKGKRESLQCQKSRLAFNLTHYKRSRSRALPCNRGDVELALQANWPLKSSERDCKKIQKKKKKGKKNTVFYVFLVTRDVRVSLRAPQLILRPTEHPVSPVGR